MGDFNSYKFVKNTIKILIYFRMSRIPAILLYRGKRNITVTD